MRIGYLNAWKDSAENQAFKSLAIAAGRIGHILVHCTNSNDIEEAATDFVIAASVSQPKLTDVATYSVLHQPRDAYLTFRPYFDNLLTYDGYLAVADSVKQFVGDILFALGREEGFGFYYNSCQTQATPPNLADLIAKKRLRITYFGTNWDRRRQGLFKRLSDSGVVQICGPANGWTHINQQAYGGSVPFDGEAVQQKYRDNGVGLCILSDGHFAEDVISNRIFETTSVGAIAICCDTPWIRKYFGDAVYYVDQRLRDDLLAAEITERLEDIYARPNEAMAKAAQAKHIFEEKFSAEVLLGNAIAYHERVQAVRRTAIVVMDHRDTPLISVIIRCDGGSSELLQRAINSLLQQTVGRFELIFLHYDRERLAELNVTNNPRVTATKVITPGDANGSNALWPGLRAASGSYFCILNHSDWLFRDHFEQIFRQLSRIEGASQRFLGWADSIIESPSPRMIDHAVPEVRQLAETALPDFFGRASLEPLVVSCLVASRDLLDSELLVDPQLRSSEDRYLVLSLLARAQPTFSFRATVVHDRSQAHSSESQGSLPLADDMIRIASRLFGRRCSTPYDAWPALSSLWARRMDAEARAQTGETGAGADSRLLVPVPGFVLSMADNTERAVAGSGFAVEQSIVSSGSDILDPLTGHVVVVLPEKPWDYGAQLALPSLPADVSEVLIVLELEISCGEVGVGLLNSAGTDFVYRRSFKANGRYIEFHIPIYEPAAVGRLVVHNWADGTKAIAEIHSIRLFRPAAEAPSA